MPSVTNLPQRASCLLDMQSRFLSLVFGTLAFLVSAFPASSLTAVHPIVVHGPIHLHRHHPHTIFFYTYRGHRTATFALAGDARVHLGPNPNARLADLKLGEIAHVSYTVENGRWLAHEISIHPHGSHLRGSIKGERHAHGAILGYNTSAGNITIRYHR